MKNNILIILLIFYHILFFNKIFANEIEFWLDGDNRIHERLKYILNEKNIWIKNLLSP